MNSNSNKNATQDKKRSKGAKIVLWSLLGCVAATLIVLGVMLIIAACGGTGTSNGSLLGLQWKACTTVLGIFVIALVLAWLLTEPSFKKEEEVFEVRDIYQTYVKKAEKPRPVVKAEEPKKEEPIENSPSEDNAEEVENTTAAPEDEEAKKKSEQINDESELPEEEEEDDDDEDEADDDAEDDDDVDTPDENSAAGLFIGAFIGEDGEMYRYRRSYMSRIIQASDNTKGYYETIKNKFLSYKNVKSRTSWGHETFNCGRKKMARLNVRGKTLVMYLALDPAEYVGSKYHVRDMSEKSKYAAVPVMVRVKSPRGEKFALELIEQLMEKNQIPVNPKYTDQSFDLAARDNDALVEEGLVKVVPVKKSPAPAEAKELEGANQ